MSIDETTDVFRSQIYVKTSCHHTAGSLIKLPRYYYQSTMSTDPSTLSRFQRFWKSGGRVAAVTIPSLIGLHYMWFKIQYMDEIIPDDQRKSVLRVGPLLCDKEQNITVVKADEFFMPYEKADRKAGK